MQTKLSDLSTKKVSNALLEEIKKALQSVQTYGSVEIYIHGGVVSQISTRNIKKTVGKNGNAKVQ